LRTRPCAGSPFRRLDDRSGVLLLLPCPSSATVIGERHTHAETRARSNQTGCRMVPREKEILALLTSNGVRQPRRTSPCRGLLRSLPSDRGVTPSRACPCRARDPGRRLFLGSPMSHWVQGHTLPVKRSSHAHAAPPSLATQNPPALRWLEAFRARPGATSCVGRFRWEANTFQFIGDKHLTHAPAHRIVCHTIDTRRTDQHEDMDQSP
jgi:hypothetical protein